MLCVAHFRRHAVGISNHLNCITISWTPLANVQLNNMKKMNLPVDVLFLEEEGEHGLQSGFALPSLRQSWMWFPTWPNPVWIEEQSLNQPQESKKPRMLLQLVSNHADPIIQATEVFHEDLQDMNTHKMATKQEKYKQIQICSRAKRKILASGSWTCSLDPDTRAQYWQGGLRGGAHELQCCLWCANVVHTTPKLGDIHLLQELGKTKEFLYPKCN